MGVNTIIKWLHRFTTILLIIIVGGYLSYEYLMNSRNDERLTLKKDISENVTLYVTQYGGGATVPDVYRYYLDKKNQTIEQLRESEPFLVSDNGSAIISGYGNTINVKLSGRIYSFSNLTMFYAQENLVIPVINLTATGVR